MYILENYRGYFILSCVSMQGFFQIIPSPDPEVRRTEARRERFSARSGGGSPAGAEANSAARTASNFHALTYTIREVIRIMKKERKQRLAFEAIRSGFPQLRQAAVRSGARSLLHHERIIRSQIRRLQAVPGQLFPDYQATMEGYAALLDDVSRRLLEQYNQAHRTAYRFEDVTAGRRDSYLKSGILSVLVASHIPQMVSAEFARLLPENPRDEYPEARRSRRKFCLHLGDTNTGKTYQAIQRLKAVRSGIYLAPLRILALENFERLNREGIPCSLVTGEEEFLVPHAEHLCCTVEKAALNGRYDVAVLDEVQLLSDAQRGDAWTRAILGLRCPEIHLCGAALAKEQLLTMIRDCGDVCELEEYRRLVPLQMLQKPVRLSDPRPGDAFVAFSKRRVMALSRAFREKGVQTSVIYGDLPPEVRRAQYARFLSGQSPVLVATDAIGMGVNLPIRRIVFTDVEKYDGNIRRPLSTQEVKQIAGRAGRIGIYDIGYVGALDQEEADFIAYQLQAEDEPVRQAVVGPSEAILEIPLLPLQEKLALWSTRGESLPYYRKKDLRDELLILELLKPYALPESVEWQLMRVPFDLENDVLPVQFDAYVKERFVQGRSELTKPQPAGQTRTDLETYYQQISLYYACSKAMGLPVDQPWVLESRERVSRKIQALLERL